jgi:hypothetical protein
VPTGNGGHVIADVIGRPVKHNDLDRNAWIDGSVAAGVRTAQAWA